MSKAALNLNGDITTIRKHKRKFSVSQELIDKIDEAAGSSVIEDIQVNGISQPIIDKTVNIKVPLVINNTTTSDSLNALSALQGKRLADEIEKLKSIGHILSTWDCVAGLPGTQAPSNPYIYTTGDIYIVSNVANEGGINYRPSGVNYIEGVASYEQETESVHVNDLYVYDGYVWTLICNSGKAIAIDETLSTTSTNPVENRVVTNALNSKANKIDLDNKIVVVSENVYEEDKTAYLKNDNKLYLVY